MSDLSRHTSSSIEKRRSETTEDLEAIPTHATYYEESVDVSNLSQEHRDYLIQRHGTLELDPLPGHGSADPYNWPQWKKVTNLVLVAFHALMGTFTAASITPAYLIMAADLGVSLQRVTYLTSLQIAILGGAPLFWKPLSNRYGRRPIFLISLICSLICNIGCAKSPDYASMAACRALVAFFISPAGSIGSGVVTETFFKKERARYMGVWTLLVTLGVPTSPFIFGFVAQRVNYRWIYWILAMINGVQFILYSFLGPETRYIRRGVAHEGSNVKQEFYNFRRIDPTPLRLVEFVAPLKMAFNYTVAIPAAAYAMIFLFGSVMITVEVPTLFGAKFHFGPQALGLQFIAIIIGSVIGEQIGGTTSDYWMNSRERKTGNRPRPEYRLWLTYAGFVLTIVGAAVFLVQIQNAAPLHWNVTPLIGGAIAAAGNQIVTTVLITYAVDCNPNEASSVGVFITFVRQIWGFIGPFWFPQMFTEAGLMASAGIVAALIVAVSIVPTLILQFALGRRHRPVA